MVKKEISESFSASLVLPRIIANMLGFDEALEILDFLKNNAGDEMEVRSGLSNFMAELVQRFKATHIEEPFLFITEDKLLEYDSNIRRIFSEINRKRGIKLKAFQYLALLFSEIYLDMYFSMKKEKMIDFLNGALDHIKKVVELPPYTEDDIGKMSYWMATGSGKTLIMHANYHQFIYYSNKYGKFKPNNIILITPNEDLSEQHIKEMKLSGIKAIPYKEYKVLTDAVKVVDIYKFKKASDKKNVKTIDPRAFGTGNLIFVDEGHKGTSGEIWLEHRKTISEEGFVFEYSATFQDFRSQRKKNKKAEKSDLISDYRKTIIFDYSYKFFHDDGYGKDYMIVNFKGTEESEYPYWAMLSSLLLYYEQKRFFLDFKEDMDLINIEDPLWILVGSRVVEDSDSAAKTLKSHILQFVRFLASMKLDKNKFANSIEKLLKNEIKIVDADTGQPFLGKRLNYLRELYNQNGLNYLINDLFEKVFYSSLNDSKLELVSIKNSEGEIGIRFKDSPENVYFGLIYVGKGNDKKLLDYIKENNIDGVEADYDKGDRLTKSLFDSINSKTEKPVNILIGARKFIEGWNNYRVSTMLLIEFAKNKGISAIQLFGRGVRLHGYRNSMKRTEFTNPPISQHAKEHINIVETLNVLGIDANYMEAFKEELEQDIEFFIEKEVIVEKDPRNLIKSSNLKIVKQKDGVEESFKSSEAVNLEPIPIRIDIRPFVQKISKDNAEKIRSKGDDITKLVLSDDMLDLVDWEKVVADMRMVKKYREIRNMSIPDASSLREFIRGLRDHGNTVFITGNENIYNDHALSEKVKISQSVVISVLRKIMSKVWSHKFKKFSYGQAELVDMKESLIPEKYVMKIPISQRNLKAEKPNDFVNKILNFKKKVLLYDDIKDILNENVAIHFERHIYEPLFVADEEKSYELYPPGLNKLEKEFVKDLRNFVTTHKNIKKRVVLFRNNERMGVGFYRETERYYPDFILWVVDDYSQKITFIDPKGLVHVDEEKVSFNRSIKDLERELKKKYDENIELYAFMVTETPQKDIGDSRIRENPRKYGIFLKSENYIEEMFEDMGVI